MGAPEIYHPGGHKLQEETKEREVWGALLQGHLQDLPPDRDRKGVELQVDKLIEGTKLHQIVHSDCVSQGQIPGRDR